MNAMLSLKRLFELTFYIFLIVMQEVVNTKTALVIFLYITHSFIYSGENFQINVFPYIHRIALAFNYFLAPGGI
jgi:hypothetical protein